MATYIHTIHSRLNPRKTARNLNFMCFICTLDRGWWSLANARRRHESFWSIHYLELTSDTSNRITCPRLLVPPLTTACSGVSSMKNKDNRSISILQLTTDNPVATICPAMNMRSPTPFTLEGYELPHSVLKFNVPGRWIVDDFLTPCTCFSWTVNQ